MAVEKITATLYEITNPEAVAIRARVRRQRPKRTREVMLTGMGAFGRTAIDDFVMTKRLRTGLASLGIPVTKTGSRLQVNLQTRGQDFMFLNISSDRKTFTIPGI